MYESLRVITDKIVNNDSLNDPLRLASSCKQSLNSKIQGSKRLNINVAFRFTRRRNKNQKNYRSNEHLFLLCCQLAEFEGNTHE